MNEDSMGTAFFILFFFISPSWSDLFPCLLLDVVLIRRYFDPAVHNKVYKRSLFICFQDLCMFHRPIKSRGTNLSHEIWQLTMCCFGSLDWMRLKGRIKRAYGVYIILKYRVYYYWSNRRGFNVRIQYYISKIVLSTTLANTIHTNGSHWTEGI